ncbi:MAG TPA: DUF4365 domain-containing protein [Bacillota bacterium]|nr:DUF4365 domain-containing protein [Bacillota bacterium]
MPNTNWNDLSPLQLGPYAEYFAKMEFASYGLEVYTSEVDDHGIDFIVKTKQARFCEIQVKSAEGMNYVFVAKSKFDTKIPTFTSSCSYSLPNNSPISSSSQPQPGKNPAEVFVERDYNQEGQTSPPEYGINISQKNYRVLERYKFEDAVKTLI